MKEFIQIEIKYLWEKWSGSKKNSIKNNIA